MPPNIDLKSFKTKMKRETSRIINQLPLSTEEANILKNEAHDLINRGKNENTIINELDIHAGTNFYKQYRTNEQLLEEYEREKKNKYDVLHPPLEDTSAYKDVKKYTKEMVIARVKNEANKKEHQWIVNVNLEKKYVRKIPRFIAQKSFRTR